MLLWIHEQSLHCLWIDCSFGGDIYTIKVLYISFLLFTEVAMDCPLAFSGIRPLAEGFGEHGSLNISTHKWHLFVNFKTERRNINMSDYRFEGLKLH